MNWLINQYPSNIDCSKIKLKITLSPSLVLVFLLLLLLLELLLLPFLHLQVRLPPLLPVKDYIPIDVHAVRYLRKAVVSAVRAEPNFVLVDVALFPAKVTLPNKPPDAENYPPVQ